MRQNQGTYRCKVVAVSFGDEVWEDAYVEDVMEKMLVIYSHFNGIYEEQPNGKLSFLEKYCELCREEVVAQEIATFIRLRTLSQQAKVYRKEQSGRRSVQTWSHSC